MCPLCRLCYVTRQQDNKVIIKQISTWRSRHANRLLCAPPIQRAFRRRHRSLLTRWTWLIIYLFYLNYALLFEYCFMRERVFSVYAERYTAVHCIFMQVVFAASECV